MEYDDITAFHYASYRPPLHAVILERYLGDNNYDYGLDIGSGTGQSSIALANLCKDVVGIEPSSFMLSKAMAHPKVKYSLFDKDRIDFKENTFDIVTLAGSLWYGKSQRLLDEITRVAKKEAIIVIYDFEILFESMLTDLGYSQKESDEPYNHLEDFSGLNTNRISQVEKISEKIPFKISITDLAHLVLSVKDWHTSLKKLYDTNDLYKVLVEKLGSNIGSNFYDIQANTYFTSYFLK